MITHFSGWWFARLAEIWALITARAAVTFCSDRVIVADDGNNLVAVLPRRHGRSEDIPLFAVAGFARRRKVVLRPPAHAVLTTQCRVPGASKRELKDLLRHELCRVTPFTAEMLFWRWDEVVPANARGNRAGASHTVTLTMVPRSVCSTALAALKQLGVTVDYIDVGTSQKQCLPPVEGDRQQKDGPRLLYRLSYLAFGLFIFALLLPVGRQTVALRNTEHEIAGLAPRIQQAQALRHQIAARQTGRDILNREADRVGNIMEILATLTRVLPDDAFLNNLVVQRRQLTFSGQAGSAAQLITLLADNPTIHEPAFAAPVMHLDRPAADIFLIRARYGP
ncbi:MAG TPA: PilN domain-containing protein [Rhodopila sp.]|nr:PilN domain-containing protein [Rhodopila sp.]